MLFQVLYRYVLNMPVALDVKKSRSVRILEAEIREQIWP